MITQVDPQKPALVMGSGDSKSLSFGELLALVTKEREKLGKLSPGIADALEAEMTPQFIARFIASLEKGRPVAIFSAAWTEEEKTLRRELLTSSACHPETAVVLFTSGSTGTPKLVQLSMGNIEANTRAVLSSLDFGQAASQTLFLPLSYSFGLLGQLLPALKCGMTTRLLSRFTDAKTLFDEGRAEGMWSGVPSHWEALLRLTESLPESCARITHVISAGAPMSVDLRKRLAARFSRATLYNNYGQTEAAPRVLSFSSRHPEFFSGPVGFPVGELKVRLASDGELCVSGSQIMLGYLGEPEATREKVQDGWLHTGDVASISPEGLVSIHGRRDELFNIGGERTSPLEIEAAIRKAAGVADAAILIEDDQVYGHRISAFVVPAGELTKKELTQALSERLSPLKTPREFYAVPSIPRGANGKLLRGELKTLKATGRKL